MSAAQILDELPKLNREERKRIAMLALDLNYDQRGELDWADTCTEEAFLMLDQEEAHAAQNQGR